MARILVIDDNAANLDLMLYLLRAFGHQPQGVTDGVEGYEAARSGEFALVLADILMPGIDGYELARRLKKDDRVGSTPLVAVTALAMTKDLERMRDAGFNGYITKPIEPTTFVSQVEHHLRRDGRV